MWLAIALGVGLRLLIALAASDQLRDDATYYVKAAADLAAGKGYLLRGHPTAYWPVGYPAFLALVFRVSGPSLDAARMVQIAMSILTMVSVAMMAYRIHGDSRRAACTAVLLLALAPSQVAYPSLMLGEVVFTTFTLAAAAFQISGSSWRSSIAAGACWAAAVFVRPVAIGLPALMGLFGPSGEPGARWKRMWVAYLLIALACVPWMLRNERVLGHPVPVSTNAGINLWMGNHPGATGTYDYTAEMEEQSVRLNDEVAFDAYARRRAAGFILAHPVESMALMARKIVILWSPDHGGGDGVAPASRSRLRRLLARLSDVFHWGLLLAAAWVAWRKRVAMLPLAVLGYYTMVYAISVASPRYLFPGVPWLVMWAAAPRKGDASMVGEVEAEHEK